MKKLFSLMMALTVLAYAGSLLARGVTNNTFIYNAVTGGKPDPATATNVGQLSASFSNASGLKDTAVILATNIVTMVTQGWDISPALFTTPMDLPGASGGYVTYTFFITNWGNGWQQMGVYIDNRDPGNSSNSAYSPGWTNSYSVALNNVWQSASNVNRTNYTVNTPVDGVVRVDLKVKIPAWMPFGSTNRMWAIALSGFDLNNQSTNSNSFIPGDRWPGVGAIAPSTVDTNSASTNGGGSQRDFQFFYLLTRAPDQAVISLRKTVSTNRIRPYESLTYTVFYTNSGSDPTINLKIMDYLSGSLFETPTTLMVAHNNGGVFGAAGAFGTAGTAGTKVYAQFTPNGGVVDPGQSGYIRFTVKVK